MKARGFDEVYQLRDGILGYLAEYPEGHFDGDCYVFDDRGRLGPDLQPSGRFGRSACGLTSDNKKICVRCGTEYVVRSACEPNWGSGM